MVGETTVPVHLVEKLRELLTGYRVSQTIIAAAKLGIADHLREGPLSVDALASRCQAHAPSLARLLRCLASIGIFSQREDGRFELTPLAQGLRTDVTGSVHGTAVCYAEGWWWDSWGRLYETVKTGETAFNRLFGEGLFDYLPRHPQAEEVFNGHMASVTDSIGRAVAASYDFSAARTLCDVGGGNGVMLREILRKHSHLRGKLFEQAAVVASGKEKLTAAGLNDRCDYVAGSFFEQIPGGDDIYLLKNIVHDWDDDLAIQILRNCRKAMHSEAKLLLVEVVIPPGNEPSIGKIWDMTMLVIVKGIERTEAEYRQLLTAASFDLTRVIDLPAIHIIEAVPS